MYPIHLLLRILLERLLRQHPQIANIPITLVFPPQQQIALRHVPLRVLLLLRDLVDVFGLLGLHGLELVAQFAEFFRCRVDLFLGI